MLEEVTKRSNTLATRMDTLSNYIKEHASDSTHLDSSRYLQLRVKGLKETEGEFLEDATMKLFSSITTIEKSAFTAERENDYSIIVTFTNKKERMKVLSSNKKLKTSHDYNKVYIEPNYSPTERAHQDTLRTLKKASGNDKLKIRGSRLVMTG
eukprot:Lithocolla_globosa_v1_NODE_4263_length_1476_cov_19.350457.p1 type:complete len:153 gc:universal NODE_4263_length_1476_cov_19.350457:1191-733(-)